MAIMVAKTIRNYPNIWENKTINKYCNNCHLFQKNVFWKAAPNLISSNLIPCHDISYAKKTMGFQSFKRENNSSRRGLGLQAFGLGGDHCEGRLFSWSLDRGALTSGFARADRPSRVRESLQEPPLPKKSFGETNSHGKMGNIGWFFHGEKKTTGGLLKYYPGIIFTHHPLKIPWTKNPSNFHAKVLEESAGDGVPVSGNARGGLYALINYIGSAYIYVHREYAGRIRYEYSLISVGWDFWMGFNLFGEGKICEKRPRNKALDKGARIQNTWIITQLSRASSNRGIPL